MVRAHSALVEDVNSSPSIHLATQNSLPVTLVAGGSDASDVASGTCTQFYTHTHLKFFCFCFFVCMLCLCVCMCSTCIFLPVESEKGNSLLELRLTIVAIHHVGPGMESGKFLNR